MDACNTIEAFAYALFVHGNWGFKNGLEDPSKLKTWI